MVSFIGNICLIGPTISVSGETKEILSVQKSLNQDLNDELISKT